MVYFTIGMQDAAFAKERIGWVGNLPVVNPNRPDRNYLGRGRVYSIQGLNSDEWIYVVYDEILNWQLFNQHHRVYKSTSLEMESSLKFLENYVIFKEQANE